MSNTPYLDSVRAGYEPTKVITEDEWTLGMYIKIFGVYTPGQLWRIRRSRLLKKYFARQMYRSSCK